MDTDLPPFSPAAQSVPGQRHLRRDAAGEPIEDADGMLQRVAAAVAAPARACGEDASVGRRASSNGCGGWSSYPACARSFARGGRIPYKRAAE